MILAIDIGGTKTLASLRPRDPALPALLERRYLNGSYPGFAAVLQHFAADARAAGLALEGSRGCIALAGPVAGQRARLTNLPWEIDAARLAADFGLESMVLANDLEASAAGLPDVADGQRDVLQAGSPRAQAPQVVVGVGTGLGVALVVPAPGGALLLPTEAGHMGFAPRDDAQAALWRDLRATLGRVSAEHVMSGPGLARIFGHLHRLTPRPENEPLLAAPDPAHAVGSAAVTGDNATAVAAVEFFGRCLGAFCGDLALATLAEGGVCLCGGIVTKLAPALCRTGILDAFRDKEPHGALIRNVPLALIREERLALLGAARLAAQRENQWS